MSGTRTAASTVEGRALAQSEGDAEAQAEIELRITRIFLQILLARHFGPLTEAFQKEIATSTDVERMRAAMDRVPHITKLDELDL